MENDFDGGSASRYQGEFLSYVAEREIPMSSAGLDDEFYPLDDDKKMGYCLIFNHKIYTCGARERTGTDIDKDALKTFFEKCEFKVEVYNDKEADEISDIISEVAKRKDLKHTLCFVCCVLTHGDLEENTEVLYGKDKHYPTEKLFTPFLECSALLHKPKMFFIQACRGGKTTEGMDFLLKHSAGSLLEEEKQKIQYKPVLMCTMPKEADFLIAHSTVPGHLAWKFTLDGSWFIQELCKVLNENAEEMDLESILTIVRRNVALKYPIEPKEIWLDQLNRQKMNTNQMKQIPSTYSTLTRKFKFPIN